MELSTPIIKVLFLGTPDFSVPSLQALIDAPAVEVGAVVTQPDRPAGRGQKLTPPPVKLLAEKHHIPVFQPRSLKKEKTETLEQLQELGPFDLGVVIAFGQILPQEIFSLPQKGSVNIHASLLPRWRGAAPIQRAILAGDAETGISLMQVTAGLDEGPVYCMKTVPLTRSTTAGELHDLLAAQGASFLIQNLSDIFHGKLVAQPQPEKGVTYASKIEKHEAKLKWQQTAWEIERVVQAFSPSPGAYTSLGEKRVKILFASAKEQTDAPQKPPGTILQSFGNTLEIQCGEGVLSVHEGQLPGRKKLPTKELLQSGLFAVHASFAETDV